LILSVSLVAGWDPNPGLAFAVGSVIFGTIRWAYKRLTGANGRGRGL